MPVVRGDRIGESKKLNQCAAETADFYAAFLSSVPDDFGRFRVSPAHVALRMYPRREPGPALLKRVGRMLAELEAAGLWTAWEVDGVRFGELTGWQDTGNLYHRTPEPPEPQHVHTRRCATTAIARAEEWGAPIEAERLRIWRKGLDSTEVEQESSRPRTEVEHPSPPSPPSPPSHTERTDSEPSVPAPLSRRGPGRETWLTPYADAWKDAYGGAPSFGPLAKALKGLEAEPAEILARWRRYLAATEAAYASPARFAATFGAWAGNGRAMVGAPDPSREQAREQAEESLQAKADAWIEAHGGRETVARKLAERLTGRRYRTLPDVLVAARRALMEGATERELAHRVAAALHGEVAAVLMGDSA